MLQPAKSRQKILNNLRAAGQTKANMRVLYNPQACDLTQREDPEKSASHWQPNQLNPSKLRLRHMMMLSFIRNLYTK